MKRIRVLFVLGSLGFGGAERQVLAVIQHLDRERFEPFLYLIYGQGELRAQVSADVPVFAYWDRHKSPRLNFPGRVLLSQVRDLRRTIANEHIDVVYDRAATMAMSTGMATPANVARVSVVAADPELDFANSHRKFGLIKRMLLRRAYLAADRTIAVSNGVREGLIRFHKIPAQKIATWNSIFDFAKLRELAAEDAPEFSPTRFHVVCVGRQQREKGQQFLLEAIDQLVRDRGREEILVWLVGTGPDEPKLRQFVADRHLQEHVRFEGFQQNPLRYVRRATLFCLPSLFEGMPNVLVEALGCGTPVIASDCHSGPREVLADGRFGMLVPPGDSAALTDAIDKAYGDLFQSQRPFSASPNRRERCDWRGMAEAGRRHVEEHFSVAVGMKRMESLLLEAAAAKNRLPP